MKMNLKQISSFFCTCIFAIFSLESAAQNYRTLPLNVQEHYYKDSLGYVFPIEPDSVKFINGDTIYYHFKTIRASNLTFSGDNYYGQYYNLYGESWAGRKTIINANGDQIWFANHNDSIIIKPLLNTNETWLVSGRHNAWGTVTGISLKTFCGISDSVKTFAVGNSIFELSKNYGFISMPDMFQFYEVLPDDQYGSLELNYPLRGPKGNVNLNGSNLISGTKTKLSDSLVYNFDVDDEFQYYNYVGQQDYNSTTKRIDKILGKTISGINSNVTYNVLSCSNLIYNEHGYPGYEGPPRNKTVVTTSSGENLATYEFVFKGNTPLASKYLDTSSFASLKLYVLKLNSLHLLEEKNMYDFDYSYFIKINDSTYEKAEIITRLESDVINPSNELIRTESLGAFYSYDYNLYWPSITENMNTFSLHYYDGHLGVLGDSPYNCDTLLKVQTGIETDFEFPVISFNSPFAEKLTIKSSKTLKQIRLMDLQGIEKASNTIESKEKIEINTQNMQIGLYILIITDQNGNQKAFKVIKE